MTVCETGLVCELVTDQSIREAVDAWFEREWAKLTKEPVNEEDSKAA